MSRRPLLFDLYDLIALVGLLMLGTSVYLWLGAAATLAFAGVALVLYAATAGSVAARRR